MDAINGVSPAEISNTFVILDANFIGTVLSDSLPEVFDSSLLRDHILSMDKSSCVHKPSCDAKLADTVDPYEVVSLL